MESDHKIRTFETGATRDTELGKLDYEGFLSPTVLKAYAEYLNKHRVQSDGKLRDSDNWQRGIPKVVYMKSLWRHFMDVWLEHRGVKSRNGLMDALCGVLFNAMGYMYETLKEDVQKRRPKCCFVCATYDRNREECSMLSEAMCDRWNAVQMERGA